MCRQILLFVQRYLPLCACPHSSAASPEPLSSPAPPGLLSRFNLRNIVFSTSSGSIDLYGLLTCRASAETFRSAWQVRSPGCGSSASATITPDFGHVVVESLRRQCCRSEQSSLSLTTFSARKRANSCRIRTPCPVGTAAPPTLGRSPHKYACIPC